MPKRTLLIVVAAAFGVSVLARMIFLGGISDVSDPPILGAPQRIVSMAPSTTEVLFALGLGDRVVGVTRYCEYPPEAQKKAHVGGFIDPNYEAIVALKPDLVVLLPVHGETSLRVRDLGLNTLIVDHRTLEGILDSIRVIGDACDASRQADEILADIHARMERVMRMTRDLNRPKVLISAGRSIGSGLLEEVYVAGKRQWYDDIITMAGGDNAYEDETVQFPSLSAEGLLRLNPDVIIEMAPNLDQRRTSKEDVIKEWSSLNNVKAVSAGAINILTGDYVTIPGPRFVQTLEDLAQAIHPELNWSRP